VEDLRIFREKQLAALEMEAIFPLWKIDTLYIISDFIAQVLLLKDLRQ